MKNSQKLCLKCEQTIEIEIGWYADVDRNEWTLDGDIKIFQGELLPRSRDYQYVGLQHLDKCSPADIYGQLQIDGFLGWDREQHTPRRSWFSNPGNPRTVDLAAELKSNEQAAKAVAKAMGLSEAHTEVFKQIIVLVTKVKADKPSLSARDSYYGY